MRACVRARARQQKAALAYGSPVTARRPSAPAQAAVDARHVDELRVKLARAQTALEHAHATLR